MGIDDLVEQGNVGGKLTFPPGLYEIDGLLEVGRVSLEGCLDFAEDAASGAPDDDVYDLPNENSINDNGVAGSA